MILVHSSNFRFLIKENKSENENTLLRIIEPLSANEIRFIETNLSSEDLRALLNTD